VDVGVFIDARMGIAESAQMVEAAGFSHLWVYDSPLVFGDVWMALGQAATATSRIRLGPGVTHPYARSSVATAQAHATLSVAAPGRTVLGFGTGFSARRTLGMKAATQAELIEHVRTVRGLLRGEWADYREGDQTHPVRFVNQDGPWLRMGEPTETWISAFGPKGQRRAGEVADGVMIRWTGPEGVAEARARFAAGAEAAGRDPSTLKIGVLFAVYPTVDDPDLEGEDVRAAIGPLVRSRLSYLVASHESAADVLPAYRPGFEAYARHRDALDPRSRDSEMYEGYLVHTPAFLRDVITADAMRAVAFIDRPDGVAGELQRMQDAGVDHVALQIAGPPKTWCDCMAAEVLPQLASAPVA
jgi:alkanesulfonate monooxygenase SsuD/methylene tetrahydromethanopterin reductase-like flavin-dependent oxidoreductase (luciferase family)